MRRRRRKWRLPRDGVCVRVSSNRKRCWTCSDDTVQTWEIETDYFRLSDNLRWLLCLIEYCHWSFFRCYRYVDIRTRIWQNDNEHRWQLWWSSEIESSHRRYPIGTFETSIWSRSNLCESFESMWNGRNDRHSLDLSRRYSCRGQSIQWNESLFNSSEYFTMTYFFVIDYLDSWLLSLFNWYS